MDSFTYDFSDEVAESFLYDSKNERIEICFDSFCCNDEFVERPCKLVIDKWIQAKSKLHDTYTYDSLESNLGVISLILSITKKKDTIVIVANTLDNKYIDLAFTRAYIRVEILP